MKIFVKMDGKEFAYESAGHKVNVGDTVILPTPQWKRDLGYDDTCEGVVTELHANYKGAVRPIIGVKVETLFDVNEIVELIENAKVIHIDGKRYTRKNGWVRG
jgi:hypothetical protein